MDRYESDEGGGLVIALIGGMALGALAMYLADPDQGRRRRALAQEKLRDVSGRTGQVVESAWRDASSRLSGLQDSVGRLVGQPTSKPIDNHVLEARVRSKLSRVTANAHAIDVRVRDGRVQLYGPVAPEERDSVLELVQSIPGVESVRDQLDTGESRLLPDWAPGTPLLALAGGALLGYYGLTRRGASGSGAVQSALRWIGENVQGLNLGALFGGGAEAKPPLEIEKTIHIKASPEVVFDVWSHYENFPHFMSNIVEVRDLGRSRSHWVMRGPAGTEVEWDAVLTRSDRPHLLAWQSVPGAMVQNEGSIRLEPSNGGTQATVSMAYRPPAGELGKTAAMLLGADPEQQLQDDLIRMREFIERGVPGRDSEQPTTTKGQILH